MKKADVGVAAYIVAAFVMLITDSKLASGCSACM